MAQSMVERDMTMIERVARALHGYSHPKGNWPSRPWDEILDNQREWHMGRARAAILAMRDPTDAMCAANYTQPIYGGVDEGWRMMIDAALSEPKE